MSFFLQFLIRKLEYEKKNNENRARIIIEIIEKMRKEVGPDFIISMKINCEECYPDGITQEGFLTACN